MLVQGLLAVFSALKAERDPKGDMKAEVMIFILPITQRNAATYHADSESQNQ